MQKKGIEEILERGLAEDYKDELYNEALDNDYTEEEALRYADDWVRSNKGQEIVKSETKMMLEPYIVFDSKITKVINDIQGSQNEIIHVIKKNTSKPWAIALNMVAAALGAFFGPFAIDMVKYSLNHSMSISDVYAEYKILPNTPHKEPLPLINQDCGRTGAADGSPPPQ
jgi:hypothetical protein